MKIKLLIKIYTIYFIASNSLIVFATDLKQNQIELSKGRLEAIDEMVNKALDLFFVPGVSIGIIIDGEIVLTKGYGFADSSKDLKVTENTLFAIGSCTKAFTTQILGQLIDEGKVSLNDPVIKYIPEFCLKDEYATSHITIKDLVTHSSGLPRHDLLWYNEEFSRNDLLKRLKYLEPTADLRAVFQYNNLMYVVVGLVIEKVTKMSWEEAVRLRIFTPLGMDRSNFSVFDSLKTDDYALPYTIKNNTLQSIPFHNIENAGPAGSINSNAVEMARWVQLQLCDGLFEGKRLLSSETLKLMHTPQIALGRYPEGALDYFGYGLGWCTGMYKENYLVAHSGQIDGFISFTGFLPKKKIGLIILTNSTASINLAESLAAAIFDCILKESDDDHLVNLKEQEAAIKAAKEGENKNNPVISNVADCLNDYVGKFYHPGYGLVEVEIKGGCLIAKYGSLSLSIYDNFIGIWDFFPDQKFQCFFFRDSFGTISEICIPMEPSVNPIVFKRK